MPGLLACAALILLWLVRDQPLSAGDWLRIDGLSAFFVLAAPTAAQVQVVLGERRQLHTLLVATLLAIAFCTPSLPLLVATLAGAAFADALFAPHPPGRRRLALAGAAAGVFSLAGAVVLLGLRSGVWFYHLPGAGFAMNSLIFFGVLLASLLYLTNSLFPVAAPTVAKSAGTLVSLPLAIAWLYPLLRLYSLGPWNTGWLLATLLLGAAAALYAAWHGVTDPSRSQHTRLQLCLGLALAGAGLGSSAGIAASLYALTVAPLLAFGAASATPQEAPPAPTAEPGPATVGWHSWLRPWEPWLLSCAFPLAAPFVAVWMAVGAAATAGVTALAVALWAAALLDALATARRLADGIPASNLRIFTAAWLSLILGAATPVVFSLLLQPAVAQLAGGLTPFGDIAIWPWAGLLALDSARRTVAALPSLALVGLMLAIGAMAWLATHYLKNG